jgi:hypothetical protein
MATAKSGSEGEFHTTLNPDPFASFRAFRAALSSVLLVAKLVLAESQQFSNNSPRNRGREPQIS